MATKTKTATTNSKAKTTPKSTAQHIRDYLQRSPDASPTKVVQVLKKRGVKFKIGGNYKPEQMVSNIKHQMKKRAGASSSRRSSTKPTSRPKKGELTFDDLKDTKQLADRLGGVDRLETALDVLKKIQL